MIKFDVLKEIQNVSPIFKPVDGVEYRIRCPICGDSQKDPNDTHCYIKCSNDTNEPLKYKCFLCNAAGIVNKYFLQKVGVSKKVYDKLTPTRNHRISIINTPDVNIVIGKPIIPSFQTRYIEERLGPGFTEEDYDRFKIVWDFSVIRDYITDPRVLHSLPTNDQNITFLTEDKTMIVSRTFESSEFEHQWRKIRIIKNDAHSYYSIKATLDIFTSEPITINIAEGIFDILSVYRNFNSGTNSVYLAALGSDYVSALEYLVCKGIIGTNVDVRIYIDDGIDEKTLIANLKRMKWMFHTITILKNIIFKDVGVRDDQIKLIEKKV